MRESNDIRVHRHSARTEGPISVLAEWRCTPWHDEAARWLDQFSHVANLVCKVRLIGNFYMLCRGTACKNVQGSRAANPGSPRLCLLSVPKRHGRVASWERDASGRA